MSMLRINFAGRLYRQRKIGRGRVLPQAHNHLEKSETIGKLCNWHEHLQWSRADILVEIIRDSRRKVLDGISYLYTWLSN